MVAEEGAAAAVVNLPHYQEAERPNSLGSSLMQQKQFQDALDTYTLAVNLAPAGPKSHVYYSNRSAAYLSLNMNERSIRDCVRSIALIKPTEEGGWRRRWGILLEKRIRDWSWRTSRVGGIERLWTRTRRAWKGYQTTSEHAIIR
jgi:tetratricopeptide (TPR) repeat protein